jgi:CDP-4-dehydro-6-deoxyglucose reductase
MPDTLTLSRAARLASVSRGDLQARLKRLDIEMFEGKISVADLLRAYPDIDIDADPTLERLAAIREEAFARRGRKDSELPDAEVLMARLHDFQTTLTKTKASLNVADQLVRELNEGMRDALSGDDRSLRAAVQEMQRRLDRAVNSPMAMNDREAALFAKDALLSLMSANVKLLPSGHEFFVTGRDSVLEAALKAGLHVDYGCASGNCGQCKVRVLSGRVKRVRDYDYVLSAREQEQGYVLACSNTPVTDLLVEASEAARPADLPPQQVRAVVRKLIPLDDDLALLELQTPRTKTLRFMAGQRVVLTNDDGISTELPVASCPCDARNLQFLIRRRTGVRLLDPDGGGGRETLMIDGPRGESLLLEDSDRPAIFLSVGDGIASIKSLVEHAIAIDNVVTLHLFRIDDIPIGSHLGNLCRSWHDALDNFSYTRLPAGTAPQGVLDGLLQRFPRLHQCDLYAAGPADWIAAFQGALDARGIARDNMQFDTVDLHASAS